jgi:hypothetical protein
MNCLLLIEIIIIALLLSPALAATGVALMFANTSYTHVARLKNPLNDAKVMSKTLKHLVFEVVKATDLAWKAMQSARVGFGRKVNEGVDASVFWLGQRSIKTLQSEVKLFSPYERPTPSCDGHWRPLLKEKSHGQSGGILRLPGVARLWPPVHGQFRPFGQPFLGAVYCPSMSVAST